MRAYLGKGGRQLPGRPSPPLATLPLSEVKGGQEGEWSGVRLAPLV